MAFTPQIKKARFVVHGYSAERMLEFGGSLADHIRRRIEQGETVDDGDAPPLTAGYAKYKTKRGGQGIRDLTLTGRTLRSLKPLEARENRVVIGFTDAVAAQRIHMNARISRQFGASPRDKEFIAEEFRAAHKPVTVEQIG